MGIMIGMGSLHRFAETSLLAVIQAVDGNFFAQPIL